MLGKLMKHELRYTSRVCLPALAIMLGVAVIGRLFTAVIAGAVSYDMQIILESMSIIGNVFLMAGAAWVILILLAVRFYRNLTRDEGYLMFTLPVKPSQLILSKLLTSYIWYFAAGVMLMISLAVSLIGTALLAEITSDAVLMEMEIIGDVISDQISQYTGKLVTFAILLVLSMLFSPFMAILMLYASIATGQLVFPKNRLLGAVLSYFGFNFLMQTVTSLFSVPFTISMNSMLLSDDLGYILTNYNLMLVISLLISLLFTVTFFLITNYIFTKRLNLE